MPSKAAVWTGWIIAVLAALLFTFSAVMKVKGGPDVEQGFAHLGLPLTMMLPLAVLELTCLVVYLVPPTAVLGAVLLTGYLGGAICTHWRVGDPFVVHIVLGLALWLSVYLREPRLRALLPVRRG
jgi:hypothetical protein